MRSAFALGLLMVDSSKREAEEEAAVDEAREADGLDGTASELAASEAFMSSFLSSFLRSMSPRE